MLDLAHNGFSGEVDLCGDALPGSLQEMDLSGNSGLWGKVVVYALPPRLRNYDWEGTGIVECYD